PDQNYSGEKTTIQYTVTNFGADVWSGTQYWTDNIFFSLSPNFEPNRVFQLASVVHSNAQGLHAGASYTETAEVTLPKGIGGNFWVFVITDARGPAPASEALYGGSNDGAREYYRTTDFEGLANNNNIRRADLPIIYREPDLQVS